MVLQNILIFICFASNINECQCAICLADKICYIVSYSAGQFRLMSLGEFGCVFIYQNNEFIKYNFILVTYTHFTVSVKQA